MSNKHWLILAALAAVAVGVWLWMENDKKKAVVQPADALAPDKNRADNSLFDGGAIVDGQFVM